VHIWGDDPILTLLRAFDPTRGRREPACRGFPGDRGRISGVTIQLEAIAGRGRRESARRGFSGDRRRISGVTIQHGSYCGPLIRSTPMLKAAEMWERERLTPDGSAA
jgi:hypothetical protein